MATERLIHEVKTDDLPKIDIGSFNWQPVDRVFPVHSRVAAVADPSSAQQPIAEQFLQRPDDVVLPATSLGNDAFPLNMLEDKTFAGTGYNVVWRPRGKVNPLKPIATAAGTNSDVLELNLTAETMTFTKSLGDVPNRGVTVQEDLILKGISYVQRVGAFENDDTGSNDARKPVGIHFEPGVFMFVPACEGLPAKHPATINRMGSIPHGTTINAQGTAPTAPPATGASGAGKPPTFPVESIFPFRVVDKKPVPEFFPQHLNFDGKDNEQDNRLPNPLSKFKKSITREIFQNPNEVLRKALDGQQIKSFVTFQLTTRANNEHNRKADNPNNVPDARNPPPPPQPDDKFVGGGTANIGFLQGTDQQSDFISGQSGNAHAHKMTVRYWIETVAATLTVKPKATELQKFRMVSKAGVLGPTFVVSVAASAKLNAPTPLPVTWTQLQYSQNVTLNFNGLSWPHISVATLGDTSTIDMSDDSVFKKARAN